jgi:hypothetical protein
MNTTHDDATTWRDLVDQLTPDQIAYLELWEQRWPDEVAGALLEARSYVEQNLATQLIFAGVDAPEGVEDGRVYVGQQRDDGTWVPRVQRHVADGRRGQCVYRRRAVPGWLG